ncbi:hypothetical protein JYU34_004427 [Plutella xylostella]|uniref:FLYWCH-type domain-containing protein n=1 Tax=Plutella xylostella TaxID=51655 RepID=A0ABQ7QXZ7_PLUXY|nr:hypothetical protein JYU34_004427 [Plutella xylostella]
MSNGKRMYLFGGFTFNRCRHSGEYLGWYCSNYHNGCKASVLTTRDYIPAHARHFHNHDKPYVHRASNGIYTVVKSERNTLLKRPVLR